MFRQFVGPEAIRMAQRAELDCVMLDMEHGPISFEQLSATAVAGRAIGVDVHVRVPELSRGYISRALDCGAAGVMAPMISSVKQAQALVNWSKYAPLGERGISSVGGMSDFHRSACAAEMMQRANCSTLAIAQIETAGGIAEIDCIAALPGIDVLLVGPNDLSVSLGIPDQLTHPKVDAAIECVAAAAARHHKCFAMHAGINLLERWASRGLSFILHGLDIDVFATGLKALGDAVRALPPLDCSPREGHSTVHRVV